MFGGFLLVLKQPGRAITLPDQRASSISHAPGWDLAEPGEREVEAEFLQVAELKPQPHSLFLQIPIATPGIPRFSSIRLQ